MRLSPTFIRFVVPAVLLLLALPLRAQGWEWASTSGDVGYDEGFGIALDTGGNVYVTGSYQGTVRFGPFTLTSGDTEVNVFFAKYAPGGAVQWAWSAGGASDDIGYGTAVDAEGNVYFAGRFQETVTFGPYILESAGEWDIFVVKCSPEGEVLWAERAGGEGKDEAFNVAVAPDGDLYVTGLFFESVTFGEHALTSAGGWDVFLAKYSPEGEVRWVRSGGGPASDVSYMVASDAEGNAYVTGRFHETATFGAHTLQSAGSFDVFLVKFSPEGEVRWAERGGSAGGGERGYGVAVDAAGDVYVSGKFQQTATFGAHTLTSEGETDIFLVKYGADGAVHWARRAGGPALDVGRGVVAEPAGSVYLTGRFQEAATFSARTLQSAGHSDLFLARYTSDGDLVWARRGGGGGSDDGGSGLAVDTAGGLYVSGYLTGPARFGAHLLPGVGRSDTFVAKYDPRASVAVHAEPMEPPVVLPPSGGTVGFTVVLSNVSARPVRFTTWLVLEGPGSHGFASIPLATTLHVDSSHTWRLSQQVPPGAPPGKYVYHVHTGVYPEALVSDSFTFEKLPGQLTTASGADGGWSLRGWEEPTPLAEVSLPEATERTTGYALSAPRPNPFGAATRLSLTAAEAQHVTAEALDALGRRVAVLHDGPVAADAGVALVFEAGALPVGLYVVRVTGEHFTATRRVSLIR